jgi:hypothetical protein
MGFNDRRGFLPAYFEYLRNPDENKTIKALPYLFLLGDFVEVGNDFVLPIIGMVDDGALAPTLGATALACIWTFRHVNRNYR